VPPTNTVLLSFSSATVRPLHLKAILNLLMLKQPLALQEQRQAVAYAPTGILQCSKAK